MLEIRYAKLTDIPELVAFVLIMHKETRYTKFDINEEKLTALFKALITKNSGIVLIATLDDKPVGAFTGFINQHFFGTDFQSSDLFLYVLPAHRGSKAGYLLAKKYIEHAELHNVKDICIGTSTSINTEQLHKFYAGIGFTKTGDNYVW